MHTCMHVHTHACTHTHTHTHIGVNSLISFNVKTFSDRYNFDVTEREKMVLHVTYSEGQIK